MPFDPNAPDMTIGVVGTGSMGRGIMQVAAQGGMRVVAYDEKPGAAQAAKDYIAKMLGGQVEKGRLPQSDADAALARITVAGDLAEVGKANLVIEAIIERLDAKQALFGKLEAVAAPTPSSPPTPPPSRSRRSRPPARIPSASAACISSIPFR